MRRIISTLILSLFLFLLPSNTLAHSGRTDSSGGHNCSAKSIAKGLCTGYHYHNGGSVPAPAYAPVVTARPATQKPSTPKPTPEATQAPTASPTANSEVLGVSATEQPQESPIVTQTIEPKVAGDKKDNPIVGLGLLGGLVYGAVKFLGWREKKLNQKMSV